jgi:hypothetical protein
MAKNFETFFSFLTRYMDMSERSNDCGALLWRCDLDFYPLDIVVAGFTSENRCRFGLIPFAIPQALDIACIKNITPDQFPAAFVELSAAQIFNNMLMSSKASTSAPSQPLRLLDRLFTAVRTTGIQPAHGAGLCVLGG